MSRLRTISRRLRTLLWTALTLVTVLAAVLVGVGKLLMPYSARYEPRLEAWLSEEFNQPVRVRGFTGEWKAFGPRISLDELSFLEDDGGEEVAIRRAALDFKPLNWLIPGRPLYSFRIIGADLDLRRDAAGQWVLSGLGVSGRGGGPSGLGKLARVGEVRLQDSRLHFAEDTRGVDLQFTDVQARLQMDGERMATELRAKVSAPPARGVIGDVEATVRVTLDDAQRVAGAEWHLRAREVMMAELVPRLPPHPLVPVSGWLNGEAWGHWRRDEDLVIEGVVDLRNAVAVDETPPLLVDRANARVRVRYSGYQAWRLDLADLVVEQPDETWQARYVTLERNAPGNLGLWVSADGGSASLPLRLTRRSVAHYGNRWPRNMPERAEGRIDGLELVFDGDWQLIVARGRVTDASVFEWDRWPSVRGVSAVVDLAHGEGTVDLAGKDTGFDWPRNFTEPVFADIPACALDVRWGRPAPDDPERWRPWAVELRDCRVRNEDFEAFGRLSFRGNPGKPAADMNVVVERADLGALRHYWPRSVVPRAALAWLDRGLVRGEVAGARATLRGDLDDWPFRAREGHFALEGRVTGAEIDYVRDWPSARAVDAELSFRGTGMRVAGRIGALAGAAVEAASVEIPDLENPVLELAWDTPAELGELVGFLRETPLPGAAEFDSGRLALSGAAATGGRLVAPLGRSSGELAVDGRLSIEQGRFEASAAAFALDGIAGEVRFDREGFRGPALSARFGESDARLAVEAEFASSRPFEATLTGRFPVKDVIPARLRDAEPALQALEGAADWRASLVTETHPRRGRETWLEVTSPLDGVSAALPAPLNKAAAERWPASLRVPVDAAERVVTFALPGYGMLRLELDDDAPRVRRAAVALGPGEARLPAPGQFRVGGRAERLDLDGWLALLGDRQGQDGGIGGLGLEAAALQVGELVLLNRPFAEVDAEVWLDGPIVRAEFTGEAIEGKLRYSREDEMAHVLSAEFERLYFGDPLDREARGGNDPEALPELHLYAREFRLFGLDLGETRIEGFPRQGGYRIESVEAQSPNLSLRARGDWLAVEDGTRSDFDIHITAESLGGLLDALGVGAVMEGGQTIVEFDARWEGSPAKFALERLDGEMDMSIVDGRIVNAQPGAGRLLGLLSVAALPRRLALDFRDVFGSGFAFDQAGAHFVLENGTARTDDLTLTSTAATITVSGSNDLVDKRFDYEVVVRPGVGKTLPVIGAIAGGPGGAAAGLALQGLLQKSLGDAAEVRYSMSGPWSEPAVEPILPEGPAAAPEPADAATAQVPQRGRTMYD